MKAIVIILFILMCTSLYCEDSIVLGVLERRQADWPNNKFNNYKPMSRLLFIYKDKKWHNFEIDPDNKKIYLRNEYDRILEYGNTSSLSKKYYVIFDRNNLGTIEVNDFLNTKKNIFTNCSTQPDSSPKTGNPTETFSYSMVGGKSYRPLVICSKNNYNDPSSWSRDKETQKIIIDKAIEKYRNLINDEIKKANNSDDEEYKEIVGTIKNEKYQFVKSYKSNKNTFLVKLNLRTEDKLVYYDYLNYGWFLVSSSGVKFIGYYYELVEAADFDNDGSSDLLFYNTSYNEDGYILIYNDLKDTETFYYEYN
jgi:hypothetical protein